MLTLYHHGSSVCAGKVRLALAEKGLPWKGVYVDLLAGEQFRPEFLAVNPKAVVPVLIDGNKTVTESTVISEYLEETRPSPPIFPADAYLRAKARLWTKAVDEELHPACAALTFITSHRHTVLKMTPENVEKFLSSTPANSITPEWHDKKRQYVERGLDAPGAAAVFRLYDRYMKKMDADLANAEWLVGDSYSIADISLTPYVNRLAMLGLSGYWTGGRLPRLERWFDQVKRRKTFQTEMIDWVPKSLTDDMATNGPKSWPRIAEVINAVA
jgi:ganglioside-induced differentiation-associated protein 1